MGGNVKTTGAVDVAIVGGGVVGLAIARSILLRTPGTSVVVLEKEPHPGLHASGRNSGVMHAGIYYESGTLRSRFAATGVACWRDFCRDHRVPWRDTGKLIVAASDDQRPGLDLLATKAAANGVPVTRLDAQEVGELEPNAEGRFGALYSPRTAGLDPQKAVLALAAEAKARGAKVRLGVDVEGADLARGMLKTSGGEISFSRMINAAGAHADRIAHWFGVGKRYTLFPFRGAYWELAPDSALQIRGNIYPVPNPELPFLGVHFTRSVAGRVFVGPTAMPALGREHYQGIDGIEPRGLPAFARLLSEQVWRNQQGFRRHVVNEGRVLRKSSFVRAAKRLVPAIEERDLIPCTKRGIRAQLYDREEKRLIHDFVVERGQRSLHILNAISPGFTCALPFADYVVDLLEHV